MERELWLLSATFAVSLLYVLSNLRRHSGAARLPAPPPGPRPLPLIGNLLDLRGGNLHHTLARLARAHGAPVMRLRLGLAPTVVVVSTPGAAREAFTRHDRRLAARAVPDAAGSEVVDVGQVVYGGVLNLVSTTLFSADVVDVGAESARGLRELVEELVEMVAKPNVSDLFPLLRSLDLQGWRRHAAGHFEKDKDKRGDFLDVLLELVAAGKIARENVTTILFDILGAGSDTLAITVEWAMAELLRNPGAMAKARMELDGALGSKETSVGEADAARLPFLQAVVKEAMRLHPVAPLMLPHQAVEDGVEIGGYSVAKGSTVIFNLWAIMRDLAAWERPDEFVPERFLDARVDFRGRNFDFIPFGSGRRMCPGMPMAERVVPLVLASLLRAFEWHLPDGVSVEMLDVSEKFTTANVLAVPLRAVPVAIV
ncbi:unnamed protein product [Urochloa decumbens]|uniref:Uncharacterized protein n=1 Tax=Urochloa decumbens TaxID=240449 RepID=A0ABC9BIC6_9POAL